MGVGREAHGQWYPKYINSVICLQFCQSYKKVLLRLSEHGDILEKQTMILYLCDMHNNMHITKRLPPKRFLANLVPGSCKRFTYTCDCWCY